MFTVELLVSTVVAVIGIGLYMLTYWNWSSLPSGVCTCPPELTDLRPLTLLLYRFR